MRKHLRPLKKSITVAAFAAATSLSFSKTASAAPQDFNIIDRFNTGFDAIQEGIDLLWPDDVKLEDFRFRAGMGAGFVPDYTGSDNYRMRMLPILEVKYRNIWRLYGTKLTVNHIKTGDFEMGSIWNLRFGRKEARNKALTGLGNIGDTVEVGLFARYRSERLLLSADVRQALGAGQGRTVRFTAGHGIYKDGPYMLAMALRGKWLSNKGMQTNFGITPEQAQNSDYGFNAFNASSGVSEVTMNMVSVYRMNEKARLMGLVSYGRLMDDARNSPIVKSGVGSANQLMLGAALTYQF